MERPLLIVDDDAGLQRQLRWTLSPIRTIVAGDATEALSAVRRHAPPVVTLDLGLPPQPDTPKEGLSLLGEILSIAPRTKIIVVTGNDGRENAVRAIGLGAYDFCPKPVDPDLLRIIVDRAFRTHALEEENRRLRRQQEVPVLDRIVTAAPSMLEVCRRIERAADADIGVLLLGESGTGKELLARALHRLSPRAERPFVALNCGAIPEGLLESELFGHERGAFTGAVKQTIGRIETAHGGTLFLDEVGDLPRPLQVKLLRFLQERVVERIGGRRPIPVDVRVVAATNQNLHDQMLRGDFREDLFYRLAELVVDIPPLRERPGDPVLLAHRFLAGITRERRSQVRGFSAEALAAIEGHPWPGNVRELENRVKRAVLLAGEPLVTAEDLGLKRPDAATAAPPLPLREVRERAELDALRRALLLGDGNISQAARLLQISRQTLYCLMRQHGLRDAADPEAPEADQEEALDGV